MSKRSDTIRSLFTQPPSPIPPADHKATDVRRVPAGAVQSMKHAFSEIERENEALRAQLANGGQVIEIEPALIDPSPFADRFEQQDDPSFNALKQSISERGQEIPVLLREAPGGRYQSAYGHRRIRVATLLGRPVKAIIRELSDDELVIAQGIENSAREDLSFIERAMFAFRLEAAGRARAVIQQALAIDRAEASKLIAVATAVPADLVRAIGKAPKVGRGRWQELAEALQDASALDRARETVDPPAFLSLPSDDRFMRVLSAAKRTAANGVGDRTVVEIRNSAGQSIAEIRASTRDVQVRLAKQTGSAFAQFLAARMPELVTEFHSFVSADGDSKGN